MRPPDRACRSPASPGFASAQLFGRCGPAVLRPGGQAGQLSGSGESVAGHSPGQSADRYRLYLPKDWADDPVRRAIAGVPDDVRFQTKPQIALQQMRQAPADGVPPGVALMDPAYGNDSKLRAGSGLYDPYPVRSVIPGLE
jgi:DDE superfamily endonuclease